MDTYEHTQAAIDLHTRRYPDVAATALLALRQVEKLRRHPGYEQARHWGVGPHHVELRRMGLVIIGASDPHTGAHPVDMTDDGRAVAEMMEGLRRGVIQPLRCRCCGQLSDGAADLCRWCDAD